MLQIIGWIIIIGGAAIIVALLFEKLRNGKN
jgi:hypothetical protein